MDGVFFLTNCFGHFSATGYYRWNLHPRNSDIGGGSGNFFLHLVGYLDKAISTVFV